MGIATPVCILALKKQMINRKDLAECEVFCCDNTKMISKKILMINLLIFLKKECII